MTLQYGECWDDGKDVRISKNYNIICWKCANTFMHKTSFAFDLIIRRNRLAEIRRVVTNLWESIRPDDNTVVLLYLFQRLQQKQEICGRKGGSPLLKRCVWSWQRWQSSSTKAWQTIGHCKYDYEVDRWCCLSDDYFKGFD